MRELPAEKGCCARCWANHHHVSFLTNHSLLQEGYPKDMTKVTNLQQSASERRYPAVAVNATLETEAHLEDVTIPSALLNLRRPVLIQVSQCSYVEFLILL